MANVHLVVRQARSRILSGPTRRPRHWLRSAA